MSLALFFQSLPSTVRRHEPTFQRTRATEAAFAPFAPFATGDALLEALAPRSALTLEERQALVQLLVELYQSSQHPLWHALLTRAFEPTLLALEAKDRGERDDREQRVLCAFVEALSRVRLRGDDGQPIEQPMFLVVSRATARALFGPKRRGKHKDPEMVDFDEQAPGCAPSPHHDPDPFVACLAREVAGKLASFDGGEDVARVLAGVETVGEQAEASDTPVGRIKARRHRVLAELRAELAGEGTDQEIA